MQNETISTYIESLALDLVLDLLSIPTSHFKGRTISTGATTSNILGLALGRQFCISSIKGSSYSVAENGFGGVEIEVLSAGAHASIRKAAAVVGIGRENVREIGNKDEEKGIVAFDMKELERSLKEAKEKKKGVIVCPAYGEVNTVSFRTSDYSEYAPGLMGPCVIRAPSRSTCLGFANYAIRTEHGSIWMQVTLS